jgi:hypothetical protein
MRTVVSRLTILAGLALGMLAASTASAQVKKAEPPPAGPDVLRMEIYNGPLRSVAYFSRNLSPGETGALRELQQAENEVAVTDHLLALRAQYAVDEQALEAQRRNLQMLLYGYNADITTSASATAGGGPPYGYLGPWGGYWGGWGGYASAGYSADINHTLAVGVGDEGVMKNTLARLVPTNALPELAARANRNLDTAVARAGTSDKLRAELNLPKEDKLSRAALEGEWQPFAKPGTAVYVVRALDGKSERIEGTLVRDYPDYVVIQTKQGQRTLYKVAGHILEMGPQAKPMPEEK